ncbi:MAG: hypothetical protein AAGG48_32255 [Planctomycetota bacterium]
MQDTILKTFIGLLLGLLIPRLSIAQTSEQNKIDVRSLVGESVTGKLGKPLGEVVPITCKLVTNPNNKMTDSDDYYRVLVTRVDNQVISTPIKMDFDVDFFSRDAIPFRPNYDAFAEAVDPSQEPTRSELEARFVEREFKVLAYETGEFAGSPRYPDDTPAKTIYASRAFRFRSKLILIHPKTR